MTAATTSGREALADAARLESARIYSRTVPEYRPAPVDVRATSLHIRPTGADLDAAIAYWHDQGQSTASIAFRLGCTRGTVRDRIARLEALAPQPTRLENMS